MVSLSHSKLGMFVFGTLGSPLASRCSNISLDGPHTRKAALNVDGITQNDPKYQSQGPIEPLGKLPTEIPCLEAVDVFSFGLRLHPSSSPSTFHNFLALADVLKGLSEDLLSKQCLCL